MNDLNSVLIEGIVITKPHLQKTGDDVRLLMRIESHRVCKEGDEIRKVKRDAFDIVVKGHLAETYYGRLSVGRGVRIVGCLRTIERSNLTEYSVFIEGQHVEFKPDKPKKAGE